MGHHSPCHRVHHVKDRQPEEQLQQHYEENSKCILATILQGFCINIYKVDIRCCSVQLCNIHMKCPLQISSVHVSINVHNNYSSLAFHFQ